MKTATIRIEIPDNWGLDEMEQFQKSIRTIKSDAPEGKVRVVEMIINPSSSPLSGAERELPYKALWENLKEEIENAGSGHLDLMERMEKNARTIKERQAKP